MKKLSYLMLMMSLSFPLFLFGQDQKTLRTHEIGLRFSGLNSFGLSYKTGRETTLFRVSLLALNLNMNNTWGQNRDSVDLKNSGYGVGLILGFEKHLPIVKNLNFIIGLDGGFNFNYSRIKYQQPYSYNADESSWQIMPQISCVLGVSYALKDALVISAEIYPSVMYTYGKSTNHLNNEKVMTTSNFSFGFTNSAASVTIAYRFKK
ncbi:MAG: hypothetical protein WCI71_07880 [Bacteroidota bacterium]